MNQMDVPFTRQISITAALLNPEVGDRFFVGSSLLTRVGPNSKKVKRKGKGVQDKKKRKAQSRPECPVGIQRGLARYKSRFPSFLVVLHVGTDPHRFHFIDRQHQEGKTLYSTRIHRKQILKDIYLTGSSVVTPTNHCKHIDQSYGIELIRVHIIHRSSERKDWAKADINNFWVQRQVLRMKKNPRRILEARNDCLICYDKMNEYSTVVGPGENVEDELNKAYMELGEKIDREKDYYSTKEVIKPLSYSGVGLLPTLRHTFDLQLQLEFTLHRRTKDSSISLWSDCEEGARAL
ncbi:hypothetical protein K435DRAFT_808929 [Dendrothele bispora CBS 962.96]|uniref:Uncharacterized protein n=1 Tax=Dendrothele bispora (strain CBS 962.96) TaxID=1314807 RepID=A0A4S8KZU4_DENBC|nr:hypothetical protein K435DRAFT_808929 [Dendrothele bispora CBS 962.96]